MTNKPTHPRPPTALRPEPASPYQQYAMPRGWRIRPWASGVKLTRNDTTRGLGGGIRNDK